jgi:hypothetical protein
MKGEAEYIENLAKTIKDKHGGRDVALTNFCYLGPEGSADKQLDVIQNSGIFDAGSPVDSVYFFVAHDVGGDTPDETHRLDTPVGDSTIGKELLKKCSGAQPEEDDDVTSTTPASEPTSAPEDPTTPEPTVAPEEPTTPEPTAAPEDPTTPEPTVPPEVPTTPQPEETTEAPEQTTIRPVGPTPSPERCHTCMTMCAPCRECIGGPGGSFALGSCQKCWHCWDFDDDELEDDDDDMDEDCDALDKDHDWDDEEVRCLTNDNQDCRACWTAELGEVPVLV